MSGHMSKAPSTQRTLHYGVAPHKKYSTFDGVRDPHGQQMQENIGQRVEIENVVKKSRFQRRNDNNKIKVYLNRLRQHKLFKQSQEELPRSRQDTHSEIH